MTNVIDKENEGLYRNDDLDIFKNIWRPEIERKKKDSNALKESDFMDNFKYSPNGAKKLKITKKGKAK